MTLLSTICFRQDLATTAHQENQYLVERIKHLEMLVEEMVASNQEVIEESSRKTDDLKLRVSKGWKKSDNQSFYFIRLKVWSSS